MSSLSYTREHNAWVQRVNKEMGSSVKFHRESLFSTFSSEMTRGEPSFKHEYLALQPEYFNPSSFKTFYGPIEHPIPFEEARGKYSGHLRLPSSQPRPATAEVNRFPSLKKNEFRPKTLVSSQSQFEKLGSLNRKSVTALSMKSNEKSVESSISVVSCSSEKRRQIEELEELLNLERERRIKLESELKAYKIYN